MTIAGGAESVIHTDPESIVRARLMQSLRQPFTLQITSRRQVDDWLLLDGTVENPLDGELDYSNTSYQQNIANGAFDNVFVALLQEADDAAAFSLQELSFGTTDSPIEQWQQQYALPAELIPGSASPESLQW